MVSFWVYQIAIVFIVAGCFYLFSIAARRPTPFLRTANIFGGYILMFFAYLSIFLPIAHVALLIWNLPSLLAGQITLLAAFIITATSAILGNMIVVRETTIKIPKLKNELRIMQITDAHIGLLYGREYLAMIVQKINAQNPDFIVITGDLTEGKAAIEQNMLEPLGELNAPTFFVEGNHDNYTGIDAVLKTLAEKDVQILHNEVVETHGVQLIGLDYLNPDDNTPDMMLSAKGKPSMKSVLAELPLKRDMPSVLIVHNPTGISYAAAAGVDLVLAGHTHKGQIFPFSIFAKIMFPYFGGLYRYENTQVFVSSGVGGIIARMRLGSYNEVNLLKLVP